MLRIAINGFGRIGRAVARAARGMEGVQIVAINDLADAATIRYLLSHDSVHRASGSITLEEGRLVVDADRIALLREADPLKLDFGRYGADVVLECTGRFLTTAQVEHHLDKGVKRVIISAPATDETPTYVLGVNAHLYHGEALISNASCTTNCIAPLLQALDEAYGIDMGLLTTVHSYTNDQNLLDNAHRDLRRARAAAVNIIPTTTGAARAIGRVLPRLEGRLHGQSVRVPVSDVSMADLNLVLKRQTTKEALNALLETKAASSGGILAVDRDYGVSQDFIGHTASAVFVPDLTQIVSGRMVKVMAWYDNESGYARRLLEMARHIIYFTKE